MEPVPERAPNIRDVARRAGVGVGTVSRVLNDSAAVSGRTHQRVRAAIDELGYRPSRSARTLSLGRAQAIGVVGPVFSSPSVLERLRGVAARLAESDYDLVLLDVATPEQRGEAFAGFARRVDGLLVISLPVSEEEAERVTRDGLPVQVVGVDHATLPHLAVDDVAGGELATEHLLARGHRLIGFVGDDAVNPLGYTASKRRRDGYHRALRRAGIHPSAAFERRGRHGRENARALATSLLYHDARPTAVFAASDMQAIGVLEAAVSLDLRVPEDLAVVGFDDVELAGVVGLTTVRQPLYESGRHGAEALLAAIERREPRVDGPLEPLRIVERRTT